MGLRVLHVSGDPSARFSGAILTDDFSIPADACFPGLIIIIIIIIIIIVFCLF